MIPHNASKFNIGEVQNRSRSFKAARLLIAVFLLFMVTLLSSCFFPGPGHGSHGEYHEGHGHGNGHGHGHDEGKGHGDDHHK